MILAPIGPIIKARIITPPVTMFGRTKLWLDSSRSHLRFPSTEAARGTEYFIRAREISVPIPLTPSALSLSCRHHYVANHKCHMSRCHHLHTNAALRLSYDPEVHTRFTCENCHHPILGIGRMSTQTTLASIETTVPGRQAARREPDTDLGIERQLNSLPAQSTPLRVDTSGDSVHLSTIAEGPSPARLSPTFRTRPNSGDPTSEHSASNDDNRHGTTLEAQRENTLENSHARPRKLPRLSGSRSYSGDDRNTFLGQRVRSRLRRHLKKPRNFCLHRFGLNVHFAIFRSPSSPSQPLPLEPGTKTQESTTEQFGEASDRPHSTHARLDMRTESANPFPVSSPHEATTPPESYEPLESGRPDRLPDRPLSNDEKAERIRVRRRQATLRSEAPLISTCECRAECDCRSDSVRSNAASHGPDFSDRSIPSDGSIQIADHPLQHLWGPVMARQSITAIGSHFPREQPSRSRDDLAQRASTTRRGSDSRLSQASTTCVGSTESSISLAGGRSFLLRRSNTVPSSTPRQSAEGIRPELRRIIHNANLPDRAQHAVSESTSHSPRSSESEVEEPSPG